MDKITHQVRAEHWIRILNECMNSGMSKTAWWRANESPRNSSFIGIVSCRVTRRVSPFSARIW